MSAAIEEPSELSDPAEVLLRQVHPAHRTTDGRISKQAFVPNQNDSGMLSTLREVVGAEEAHRRHTVDSKLASCGTFGVSVEEVCSADALRAIDDGATVGVPDHASIDFNQVSSQGRVQQAARKLAAAALSRGRLHP